MFPYSQQNQVTIQFVSLKIYKGKVTIKNINYYCYKIIFPTERKYHKVEKFPIVI